MRTIDTILSWLISSGFIGVLLTAAFQLYGSNKRAKVSSTADMLREVALRNAKLMFRQPDANGQRVADALTDILKQAQQPFYWHSFGDSTIGHIAKEAVNTVLDDPDIVKSIESELAREHSANQSFDVKTQTGTSTQSTSAMNIDQSIAAKQATKGGE